MGKKPSANYQNNHSKQVFTSVQKTISKKHKNSFLYYLPILLFLLIFAGASNSVQATGGLTCATAVEWTFTNTSLESDWLTTFAGATNTHTGCHTTSYKDVWYKFTATQANYYFILSADNTFGYSLYTGTCGALTQVTGACYTLGSGNFWHFYNNLVVGTTYYIKLESTLTTTTYSIGLATDPYSWTGFFGTANVAGNYAIGTSVPGTNDVKFSRRSYPIATYSSILTSELPANFTVEIGAALNITANKSVTKITNNGTINISGANTTLTTGSLYCSAAGSQFTSTATATSGINISGTLTVQNGGNLTIKPNSTTVNNLTIGAVQVDNGGYLTFNDYTKLKIANDVTINGTLRLDQADGTDNPEIGGNFTVNGTLNHQGHRYIKLTGGTSGAHKTISGSGNFYGGTIAPLWIFCPGGTAYYDFGNLGSDNTIQLTHLAIGEFSLAGTGVLSLGTGNTIETCYFLQQGVTNCNNSTLKIAGPTSLAIGSGKYSGKTFYDINNGGGGVTNPKITDANFNEGTGTVYFNSGDFTDADIYYINNQTVPSVTYYNLKIRTNNGYTVTMGTGSNFVASSDISIYNPGTAGGVATMAANTINIGGNLYIGALSGINPSGNALTLNCGSRMYRGTGTGTITMGNNSAHAINISYLDAAAGSDECFTGFGTPTFFGTVNYNGAGNQEIIPATFYNITLSSSGIKKALSDNSVTMNWTNNCSSSAFNGSTFKVTFNGSSIQNITGSFGTTFNKIGINNSTDVNILKQASISTSADFTLGDFIAGSSTEPFTFNAGSTISTAATDDSHVNGYCRKIGNTPFVFPVGSGLKYRSIAITAPSLATDHFTAKYFKTNSNPSYSHSSKDATIDHLSTIEYWTLDRTNGTPSVSVTLSWNPNSNVNSLTNLAVARWDGTTWKDHGNSGTTGTTSDGTVTSLAAVTSFSPFTLASKNASNPLPIELVDFRGTCNNDQINLFWATSSETDNNYFTLEKSSDLNNWQAFADIQGAGNSNVLISYTYEYKNTTSAAHYFRLKQTDYNGTFSYSSIISTMCNNNEFDCFQSEGTLYVDFSANKNMNLAIKLFDILGNEVLRFEAQCAEETNRFSFPMTTLSKGIYMLTLKTDDDTFLKKILIN
jgi:hypothetical protein